MALLNVHPDYVAFGDSPAAEDEFDVKHYAEFLAWVKENYFGQYWHALPRGVADFCRKKSGKVLAALAAGQADASVILGM